MTRRMVGSSLVAIAGLLAGCSGDSEPSTDGSSSLRGEVVVLAASSLTEVVGTIAGSFEAAHPGVTVRITADGSARLAATILQGVPADVFIAADDTTMDRVRNADRVAGKVSIIATNSLQIVVPVDNPLGVQGLADLSNDLVVALCRSDVPCGSYAEEAFRLAGVTVPKAGREDSVKAVLAKVVLGEADAGIVYRTDVLAAEGVRGIDLPDAATVSATYPAAVLVGAPQPALAAAFVEYLTTRPAQRSLQAAGFGPP